ncbi:hypothetical protein [Candidatus Williamhamiltonella defendens]|uniref:hypothetical protein n=1 Tax=Candidatus Williamhamiltonella defendens TaxID=138072 RepID=UPI00130DC7DE|nr:hypothetical protein [Candidatus Hamiltonella defensa]
MINIEGFRFDHAVHLSFSTETKVRIIFDKTPYIKHLPHALNFKHDRWLKHLVQKTFIFKSSRDSLFNRIFLKRYNFAEPDNYASWLIHQ